MFEKFIRAIWVMIAALSLTALSGPAYARHELSVVGDVGDAGAKVECPPGQALVGFSGRSGLWITRIQMVCATPLADGSFSQPVATGPEYGGASGTRQDGYCPLGTMMTVADVLLTYKNRQVYSIGLTCRSRTTGEESLTRFGNLGYKSHCASILQDCPAEDVNSESCPSDEMPVGYSVRYGVDVNAFGLICARVANAAAAGPPPAPRPIKVIKQTGRPRVDTEEASIVPPPPPTKTIKHTGRATDGSDAALEPNPWISKLAGVWHMTTSQNAHFDLTITVTDDVGHGATVNGDFVNRDGESKYDGNLHGFIPHDLRRVTFSYSQPGSNGAGNGMMTISTDGTKLSGDGVDGPSKVKWSWSGTRD